MRPLLSSDYPCEPFPDFSLHLGNAQLLSSLSAKRGYLYCKGLIPVKLLEPIRNFVRMFAVGEGWVLPDKGNPEVIAGRPGARLSGRGWDDPRWIELQRVTAKLPAFQDLIENRTILEMLACLYGEPAAPAMTNHVWLKLPGSPEHTTRSHRDSFYLPDCQRMWTAWIPLTRTPMEVGPLGIVPGSHLNAAWPQRDALAGIDVPREVRWATQAVDPGDVVFFGADTIHCAWSNMSPTVVRLSLDVRYEPSSTPNSILRPAFEPDET